MKTLLMIISVLALEIKHALSVTGVDVSQYIESSAWGCMMSPGGQGPVNFAIVRVFMSSGQIDPNGADSIRNALSAGVPHVDGYIFPCVPCGNAAQQVQSAIESLNGVGYGMLWYDIETYDWHADQASNQAFIQDLIDAGKAAGIHAGIYTNYNNWESIVGLDWSYPASQGLPLWYAHYDNSASFGDFQGFGGWNSPNIKQYIGSSTSCGVGVDYDYYPS